MNEAQAKRKLNVLLTKEDCNALIFASAGSMYSGLGIPDWFLAHHIWQGWIEHKFNNGRITPGQKTNILKLMHRGVKAVILRHNYVEGNAPSIDLITVEYKLLSTFIYERGITGMTFLNWLSDATT